MAFSPEPDRHSAERAMLFEIAWEVCNQVGGIYTVIRSKVPSMQEKWGDDYVLLGPYLPEQARMEFEAIPLSDDSPIARTVRRMQDLGHQVYYGRWWQIKGQPRVVLLDPSGFYPNLNPVRQSLWQQHQVSTTTQPDGLLYQALAFGELVRIFLTEFAEANADTTRILAHFHEWLSASGLPSLRRNGIPVATVFTTHATLIGRYAAPNEDYFYAKLPYYLWEQEARRFGIEVQATVERMAAQHAHCFTTVSEVTARECEVFLGRVPDLLTPNGLDFSLLKGSQSVEKRLNHRKRLEEFVTSHFFPSYSFDLNKTLYFFTSGRYEYINKGYDLTLEAMARLNASLKQSGSDLTVVLFVITKRPFRSVSPAVLKSQAMHKELQKTCAAIERQIGERLLHHLTQGMQPNLPDLSQFIDEEWKGRVRHTVLDWKSTQLPSILTHDLLEEDEIVKACEQLGLRNAPTDPVKIVYHPDFLTATNPVLGIDYDDFINVCDLGLFPSYYEPWGYTPQECFVKGIPTVTSNVSGFGNFVLNRIPDHEQYQISVVNRRSLSNQQAAQQLTNHLVKFVEQKIRDRYRATRSRCFAGVDTFSWTSLRAHYDQAHELAKARQQSARSRVYGAEPASGIRTQ